jgi:hypothetical protein
VATNVSPRARSIERFRTYVVSGFSRTSRGPPKGGHYVQTRAVPPFVKSVFNQPSYNRRSRS